MAKSSGSAGRSGSSSRVAPGLVVGDVSYRVASELPAGIEAEVEASFPDGDRLDLALHAVDESDWASYVLARDGSGKLVGVAKFWSQPDLVDKEGIPAGRYVRLSDMASVASGHRIGERMVQEVFRRAWKQRAGLYLTSMSDARGFYEKMGFEKGIGADYFIPGPGVRSGG